LVYKDGKQRRWTGTYGGGQDPQGCSVRKEEEDLINRSTIQHAATWHKRPLKRYSLCSLPRYSGMIKVDILL
jgi:hypothetical protein